MIRSIAGQFFFYCLSVLQDVFRNLQTHLPSNPRYSLVYVVLMPNEMYHQYIRNECHNEPDYGILYPFNTLSTVFVVLRSGSGTCSRNEEEDHDNGRWDGYNDTVLFSVRRTIQRLLEMILMIIVHLLCMDQLPKTPVSHCMVTLIKWNRVMPIIIVYYTILD